MGTIIGTVLIHNDTSPFWKTLTQPLFSIGEKTLWGGGLPHETDGDARRKF